MKRMSPWVRAFETCLIVVFACSGITTWAGNPYQYPATLSKKHVGFSIAGDVHSCGLRPDKMTSRFFRGEELRNIDSGDFEFHFRGKDGMDISESTTGMTGSFGPGKNEGYIKIYTYALGSMLDAQVGDVFLGYLLYSREEQSWRSGESWVSEEFGLQCGGRGRHATCTNCFKLISALSAKKIIESQSSQGRPPSSATENVRKLPTRSGAETATAPKVCVADLIDPAILKGKDMVLEKEILIYELRALPSERVMGQVREGMTVHVLEQVAPLMVHVQFTTSTGRTYDGAAKVADLLPVFSVKMEEQNPSMPHEHQKSFKLNDVSYSRVASGTVRTTVYLYSIREDGTVAGKTLPDSYSYNADRYCSISVKMGLITAQPGDEYLCYIFHDDGSNLWVSPHFGVRAGTGTIHTECGECFSLMPQSEADALLAKLVARKKAQWARKTGEGATSSTEKAEEFRGGKVVLTEAATIYEVTGASERRVMGRVPAGVILDVLEDLGGGYARVRFTTPRGQTIEGAAQTSVLKGKGP